MLLILYTELAIRTVQTDAFVYEVRVNDLALVNVDPLHLETKSKFRLAVLISVKTPFSNARRKRLTSNTIA